MRRGKPIGRNINFEPTTGRVGLKKLKSLENSTTRFHEIEDRRSHFFDIARIPSCSLFL